MKSRCLVYENKIFVVGDYEAHECAITVSNVEEYEAGEWQCEVREYITRLAVWARPRIVKKKFTVNVRSKNKQLANRGGFNIEDNDDDAVVIEAAPAVGSAPEVDGLDEDERNEAKMALIVISTLFAMVICW